MRLTPNEAQALATLVELEQAAIDEAGQVHRASQSSVLRALLRKEAIELGVWPDAAGLAAQEKKSEPTPPAPAPVPEAPKSEPIETRPEPSPAAEPKLDESVIEAHTDTRIGMTFVPTLVRALDGDVAHIHEWLLDGARAGRWELRPESGMGRLSSEETAQCPKNSDGTVLSWVRLPHEKQTSIEGDTEAVRKRLSKAIKKGNPWENQSAFGKALAPRIGIKDGSTIAWVRRFLPGNTSTPQERIAEVDAMLREAGL